MTVSRTLLRQLTARDAFIHHSRKGKTMDIELLRFAIQQRYLKEGDDSGFSVFLLHTLNLLEECDPDNHRVEMVYEDIRSLFIGPRHEDS